MITALALPRQGAVPAANAVPASPSQLWLAVYLPELTARLDLEHLAAWANRITPLIDLEASDSLLLEVQGSLELLGGLDAIKCMVADELGSRGIDFEACAAPTARAALWLARHGTVDDIAEIEQLPSRLGALPVSVTRWPESVLALLGEIGVRSIAACLRLPRDGFARRVGHRYLLELDRALGRRADPRTAFRALPELGAEIELPSETDDLSVLAQAAERLAERMTDALRVHQCQAQRFEIVITHRDRASTVETLGLLEPVYQKPRLLRAMLARLERLVLPAPAVSLAIHAKVLETVAPGTGQLFERGLGSLRCIEAEAELVERLRGRFGMADVHGLKLVAEHRPERSWSKSIDRLLGDGAGSAGVSSWARPRPLWLLALPMPLSEGLDRLRYFGPVHVEPDSERIESGWWDGGDIRRDYHTATTEQGEQLWVYRDCTTNDWYLHGIFG